MDLFKQGMKGPSRPAPSVPGQAPNVTRYSPVTNWNDDLFGADVFEPTPQFMQKKKPPPRPPPPRVNAKPPDVPIKPSHFIRRPTVLTSLLSRKNRAATNPIPNTTKTLIGEYNNDLDPNKMFPKCEPKNVQTGALIDLSSPPSSPTFTTRSSSDGLSVDSFGSDATTSTNHHNVMSGGNASQAESGFEDDFDLFLHSRKAITKDDTLEDFTSIDPFSPQLQHVQKPPILKKPALSKDLFELSNTNQPVVPSSKGPTIIRAKPARPKPPDNSALLKNTFGGSFPVTSMSVNTTTTPIQKITNGFAENFDWKSSTWDDEGSLEREEERSPEREWSPPMPSVPPPPPPEVVDDDLVTDWPIHSNTEPIIDEEEEPCAEALFDFFTDHPEDLCFSVGSKIKLIRRVDEEWLYGRLRSGVQGVFPANYVEIKVPLPNEIVPKPASIGTAIALYDFEPVQPGDLRFLTGETITLMYKINDEWYFGECNGKKGQLPINYVQMS